MPKLSIGYKAKELVQKDCVSHCPKLTCFVVCSDNNVYTVEIHLKHKCTSPAVHDCSYIFAVLVTQGVSIDELKSGKKIANLTILSSQMSLSSKYLQALDSGICQKNFDAGLYTIATIMNLTVVKNKRCAAAKRE